MNLNEIATFFDRRASAWDTQRQPDESIVNAILDIAGIRTGTTVLDVGCGTGVLFPYYLARGASQITGVDLSSGMIARAAGKFAGPHVRLICADATTTTFSPHACCMVFNALPHFISPETLVTSLAGSLLPGGRLTIAHGESRRYINNHHVSRAPEVSHGLIPAAVLAGFFEACFTVDAVVDSDEFYAVSGTLKPR